MESNRINQSQIAGAPVLESKSLNRAPASKGLVGGGYTDPALVQWIEQATAYYNAVMAGDPSTPAPTQTEWNDFMAQLQWAQQQLGYGQQGWDPSMGGGMGGAPLGGPQQGQTNQFGGMPGTMDNWVYTNGTSQIGFTGNGTHDIWSNEFILDVAPVSAQISVTYSTDTRFQPPEQVAKVVVTDPATGTEAVYYVHDFDPAAGDTIKINTPDASQVTDAEAIATWGEFTQAAAEGSKPESSIPGEEQPDGSLLYEPEFAGEVVDFWAQPGEDQQHIVYADANISVKPSDTVEFRTGFGDQVIVEVTHSDGSKDTYVVQKGYSANVNVNEEYIEGEIPASIADRVTINGASDVAEGSMDGAAIVEALLAETGRTETQLLSALEAAGYDLTLEEFQQQLSEGKFTDPIDSKLATFLSILDPAFSEAVSEMRAGPTGDDAEGIYEDMQERLVALLSILDPNSIISAGAGVGQFNVNGDEYGYYVSPNGEQEGEVIVEQYE